MEGGRAEVVIDDAEEGSSSLLKGTWSLVNFGDEVRIELDDTHQQLFIELENACLNWLEPRTQPWLQVGPRP